MLRVPFVVALYRVIVKCRENILETFLCQYTVSGQNVFFLTYLRPMFHSCRNQSVDLRILLIANQ